MLTATIASGASLSGAVTIPEGYQLVGFDMPTGWDAAAITLQGDYGNGSYQNVYDSGGTELSVTTAASRVVKLTSAHRDAVHGLRSVKLRSGTAATPVNQTASRDIGLILDREE